MTLGVWIALFFTVGWVPAYLFRAEAVSAALPHYSAAEQPWVRLTVASLTLHMTAACVTVSFVRDIPPWRTVLGLVVFAAGIGFWFWGRVLIGPLRITRLPEEPPLRLRQDGAFGIVRHPLYAGMLLAASAPVLVAPRTYLGASLTLCAVVLAVRAVQEERPLRAHLGAAYDAYCRRVKRLVPFVW
jgi:protein-S-isoprenylcysteine O-methyltransferase Ste14